MDRIQRKPLLSRRRLPAALLALLVSTMLAAQSSPYQHTQAEVSALLSVGDLNGDGYDDYAVGHRNGVTVYSGRNGAVLWERAPSTSGDKMGAAIAKIHDVDQDGVPDFLVGAPGASPPGLNQAGFVYVLSGRNGNQIGILTGQGAGDRFGSTITALGDTDNDGTPDFAIAALGYPNGADWGQVRVISGSTRSMTTPLAVYNGIAAGDVFGTAILALGDADNDGYADLAISAPRSGPGFVRLYSSRFRSVMTTVHADAGHSDFGRQLAMIGNLVPSGPPQFAIIAFVNNTIYERTMFHTASPSAPRVTTITGAATDVAGLPDLDSDGIPEILMSIPGYCFSRGSMLRIYSGLTQQILWERTEDCRYGFHKVAHAGDINKDGRPDFLFAAHVNAGLVDVQSTRALPLWTSGHEIPISTGGRVTYHIDAGPARAGKYYLILGTLSGIEPGFSLFGASIPLNIDPYLSFVLANLNSPILPGQFGVLSAQGTATCDFVILPGLPARYSGLTFDHAYVVLDLSNFTGLEFASNARPATLK